MVAACTKAFFTTKRDLIGVHEVAKKLPASGGFKARNIEFSRHSIDRTTGGHTARNARQALFVGGDQGSVSGYHCQAIRGRDKKVITQNHVAVTITIGCRTKIWRILSV